MTPPWTANSSQRPTKPRRERAKNLRRAATEPEKKLWWHLRHRLPLEGSHFRRQVAIGPYIADFCCLGAKLVIEVDGEQHGFDANRAYDDRRTEYLHAQGYRVLRFSNRDVMTAIDVVVDTIHAALDSPPTDPQRGA